PTTWAGDHGFVNGTKDDTTGLTNLGAREYQPQLGRFLNPDPLLGPADPQQWNGYAYSNNNPVNLSDPTGLMIDQSGGANCDSSCQQQNTDTINQGNANTESYFHGCGSSHYNGHSCVPAKKKEDTSGGTTTDFIAGVGAIFVSVDDGWERLLHWGGPNPPKSYPMDMYLQWVTEHGVDTEDAEFASGSFLLAAFGDAYIASPKAGKWGCGGCSFAPETPILLENGTAKPIGELNVGDKVESADPSTGQDQGGREVQHVWINHDSDLLDVTVATDDGESAVLHTTSNHPFWDATTHTWIPAGQLEPGHQLASTIGHTATIKAITHTPGVADRYNLTVLQLHTYYALAGTTPVLVHNINNPIPGGCSIPGRSVYDIPAGSSGGPGAYATVPATMRAEYGTGVQ
ncbi:RHS repeat-associated core domain-containing protein, partial [Kitasatospora sp. NPDC049285]|uniref:RHS repeat-associated core domain-containing protein n=1 Tax=Kitasatospora sp. NPDC049285 TaxID=3157096 RepID=UPI003434C573